MSKRHLGRGWALLLLVVLAVAVFFLAVDDTQAFIMEWTDGSPVWFILLFTVAATVFVPVSILSLTSGVLFGSVLGTFCTLVAATSSATLSFFIARYFGHEWAEKCAGARVQQIRTAVAAGGWRSVAMLRLVPLMPFAPLNYSLGLCEIKWPHYVVATFIFMIPVRFAYAYVGSSGWSSIAESEGVTVGLGLTVAMCLLVILAPVVVKRYRREQM